MCIIETEQQAGLGYSLQVEGSQSGKICQGPGHNQDVFSHHQLLPLRAEAGLCQQGKHCF